MAITVILARRLGPESFGLFVFVQWLIDMAFLVFSVGLTGVATRFFPQSAGDGEDRLPGFNRWFLRAGALAVLLTSCFATLSAFVFLGLRDIAPLTAVAFWAATNSSWALLGARTQGLFQFKRFAASTTMFVGVALVGLTVSQVEGGVPGAMFVMAVSSLAAATCCAMDLFNGGYASQSQLLAKAQMKLIRPYATNAWFTSIAASLVWARGEITLVKGHLGESAVGVYSVGMTLSGLVNQGLGLLTGALWPQIARAWDNGEREELLRLYSLITNLLILVAGLSSGFVICFAPYIISLLFGEPFLQSSKLALILALGPLGLACGCAHLIVQAATNGKFARDVTLAGGVVLFGAAFALIPRFGIQGLPQRVALFRSVWRFSHSCRSAKCSVIVLTSAKTCDLSCCWSHWQPT